MHETPDDLDGLQELLDRSYALAGGHAREVITPERRLGAAELAQRLVGMCLLTVATVTQDGRPITGPVDGYFFRGSFYFGSSKESIRMRHLRQRPAVSATHLPGEELSVSVHGRAATIDLRAAEHAQFRSMLLERNVPLYGPEWEDFIDEGAVYVRIDAERMLTFHLDPVPDPVNGPEVVVDP